MTSLILFRDLRGPVVEQIKLIQVKLKQLTHLSIRSRYEILLFEWIMFTVEGIPWNMGIQLQGMIETLSCPVIFIGTNLTDLRALKRGSFDNYFRLLLNDMDKFEEFIMYFLPFTQIIDYCLNIWKSEIMKIDDMMEIDEMRSNISYTPVLSFLNEQRYILDPKESWKQRSLDEFF